MKWSSDRPFVKLLIPGALVSTLRLLEHGAEWHRHLLDVILTPFIVFGCLYLLYGRWGELIVQYRPRELFRDRVLTFPDVLMIGTIIKLAVSQLIHCQRDPYAIMASYNALLFRVACRN